MVTFRDAIKRWALPLIGLYLLIVGFTALTGIAIPAVIVGIVALIAGLAALFAS